jgi:hypothetical protein
MFFAAFLQLMACSGNSEEKDASTPKPSPEISQKLDAKVDAKADDAKTEETKTETSVKPRPKPKAKIGGTPILATPIVLGGISKDHINDVMKKNDPAIQNCHEKTKKTKGKVLVKFSVNKDGTVNQPKTESTSLRDSTTEDCLNKLIQGLQFNPLERGSKAIVRYPIVIN